MLYDLEFWNTLNAEDFRINTVWWHKQNLNLLNKKLWVSFLRAILGCFWGLLGVAHGGVLDLLPLGSLHHAVSLSFWLQHKIWTYRKNFYGLGLFWGRFLGLWGRHMVVSYIPYLREPLPCGSHSFKRLKYKILTFCLKNFDFYALELFWAVWSCFQLFLGTWGCPRSVSLYPASFLALRYFTKYEPSFSKALGFMA